MFLVLITERDFTRFGDKRSEHDCELNSLKRVEIKRLHSDVVEALDFQPGFLPDFASRCLLRPLVAFNSSVHCFPRTGTACIERTLNREDPPSFRQRAYHVDVDDTGDDDAPAA